ncbi:hypothetical protein BMF94_1777 [Rhodotorula taiwanensis]|uniref:Peroxin-14 n=1 Tax=Rhodotorula taiwanensis TaxID=741276 RepID=A0A2S5BED3_9BASI|nr:hypothetical protein BMF94_1777 [Rhodotorula taiwanensis]
MGDDQSPTAVTDAAAQSVQLPAASASDSAPPPTPQPTPVPPRTYPQVPVYIAPPPAYAPNSTVPNFLRLVAAALLVGGTLSSAVAWIYKTILYPRLVIALQARTRLFRSHEAIYTKQHASVLGLVQAVGVKRLGGADAVAFRKRERERAAEAGTEAGTASSLAGEEQLNGKEEKREDEKQPLLEFGATTEGGAEDTSPSPLPPPPRILEPVKTSLSSLRSSLVSASPSANPTTLANPSNLVQPQGMLMRSLVTLNEYLESESYAASTFHTYRPYGAYGASAGSSATASGERKALQEVTHSFKAEIRSIKGALLNRRNFTRPEAAATPA